MSTRLEDPLRAVPSMPDPIDLADVWLVDAFVCLLDACSVPEADRRKLLESCIDASEPEVSATSPATEDLERPAPSDLCRYALMFAALALEARINRVLRACDVAEWEALAHLTPVEKFRLAPRLLAGPEAATKDAELGDLVVEVLSGRDELLDASESTSETLIDAASRISPSRARAMVAASARVCSFLATLTAGDESGIARLVWRAADALTRQADRLSTLGLSDRPSLDWNGFEDFPPKLIGA